MVLLDVLEVAHALLLEYGQAILLVTAFYFILRLISSAVRSWILSIIVIVVLIGMFWHEGGLEDIDPSLAAARKDALILYAVA
ncbi:hypothetical protein LTR10_008120 [Elasticomyces elasticus]|nr:hypothetical protein LTR10_008120 [Elasticomyces elasticus]